MPSSSSAPRSAPVTAGLRRSTRWLPALALLAGAALVAPGAEAAQHGSLTITPTQAAPGEPLLLTGTLPTKVRRPVVVQRGADGRFSIVGRGRTDAHGRYRVTIPKNGMPSDPYRVFAPRIHAHHHVYRAITTPTRTIRTLEPDVTVALSAGAVGVGQSVTLTATGTPVRPGRPLTLQRRVSPTVWQTVGTSRPEDGRGHATFTLDTSTPGSATYRVRAESWNGAGWYPSLPITLAVGAPYSRAAAPTVRSTAPVASWAGQVAAARKKAQPGPVNAGNTFKWGPMTEDWAWEKGESTDPWQIYADGTGRATIYTAMMTLDSGGWLRSVNSGTVKATLQNAGHTYGRWEARVRAPIFMPGHADYTMSLGLVPARSADAHCGGLGVDLGTWTGYSSATSLGVRKGDTDWTTTRSLAHNRVNWHTLGVEITPKRIVWFVDAKVAAVLNNPAAVPGVPLVPQLVLQGRPGGVPMNHTRFTADWVRYFTLAHQDKGRIRGAAPTPKTVAGAC